MSLASSSAVDGIEAMKRLAVFCGANPGAREDYMVAAAETGSRLAVHGITVVYGGGSTGMMGTVADAALAAGGTVVGVIPKALEKLEIAHRGVSELHVVPGMHERKARMYELADGFIILPGGIGTMDELFEVLVWLHLGYHRKPVGLLNTAGFFDGLLAFLRHMQVEGFLRAAVDELVVVDSDIDRLIRRMRAFEMPPPPKWKR